MPFSKSARIAVVTTLLIALGSAAAVAAAPPVLHVPMLAHEPTIAGRLDASWHGAARIRLRYDFTNRRRAAHPPVVYVAQDPQGLDVAFVVIQHSPVIASMLSDGPGVFGDDNVQISLNPQGVQGFSYQFIANARGARFQTSSENSAYSPHWKAASRRTKTGYVVTMHVPFAVVRSGGSHVWRVQFQRFAVHSNVSDIWSYSPNATNPFDTLYVGTLDGVNPTGTHGAVSSRPAPRFQPYLLGVARSGAAGGSTSQIGFDMAVPITPTASFVGSFHPDYSNVETDQQTISPTAFPRQYQEVRPFFTQVGNAFNYTLGCQNCPQTLYTPAIPTFRQGYGVEGTQGPLTFAGFDAVGNQRTDLADALDFSHSSSGGTEQVDLQRVTVNTPALLDNSSSLNGGYFSTRGHWFVYGNYAREDGTLVTDPSQAHYGEVGAGVKTANTVFVLAHQFVGSQFNPVDGYEMQNDIGGYLSFAQQTFHFSPTSKLLDVSVSLDDGKFWNHLSQPAQSNAGDQINIDFKNLWSVHVFQQSTFVLASDGEYLPFSVGNGAFVGYNLNSNYGKGLAYGEGPYYHGQAANWQFFDTMPIRRRLSFSLNLNENIYHSHRAAEPSFQEWLNSASFNWQFSRDASLSVGARRINGIDLPTSYFAPTFTPVFADNLSAAFHYLHGHNEFYLVYGDPNALTTTPAVFFKWIFYAGAEKGT